MKNRSYRLARCAGIFLVVGATQVSAQSTNPAPSLAVAGPVAANSTPPVAVAPGLMPVFHPPDLLGGILPVRVGGGSRGGDNEGVTVEVLVPDQIALTTEAQPSLYWYQSKAARTHCEVTLTQPKKAKPLLDVQSSGSSSAGVHSVKLSDFKVKLSPNIVYRWSLAIIVDPRNRSQDILASGVIEYQKPSPELAAKLATASDSDRAAIYAGAGIWYDALDSISTRMAQNPGDRDLQDQRAKLLTQVGLDGQQIEATHSKVPQG
jgi:hypothetical protein